MQEFCHRCGGALATGSGESPFCPHCGAPQLYLSLDYQSVETGGQPVEVAGAPVDTTGTRPPPRPQQIDWKMAIRCAAGVAGVAGLLSLGAIRVEALSFFNTLWIVSGSLITMGLYQKRRPLALMDAGVGAKIGVVVGICMVFGLAIPMAAAGLVARFMLHSMGSFDAEMTTKTLEAMHNSSAPIPDNVARILGSPEFRGGIMLAGFAMLSTMLMVMSTLGGAFAGLLRMKRGPVV